MKKTDIKKERIDKGFCYCDDCVGKAFESYEAVKKWLSKKKK